MSDGQERSEPATPKRRERARQKGEHPRSTLAVCACSWWFAAIIAAVAHEFASQWIDAFSAAAHDISLSIAADPWPPIAQASINQWSAAPIWTTASAAGSAALLAAAASAAACGGIAWSTGALKWKFNRLAPAAGVRALMSSGATSQALLGFITSAGVIALAFFSLHDEAADAQVLSWRLTMVVFWHGLIVLWWRVGALLLAVALVDVTLARRRFSHRLRMTPREVHDERAEQEGRPEVKARRRGIAIRRARRLRVAAIRQASAIVTNPSHVAVALQYAPPHVDVPMVVAAGAGAGAHTIRAVAAFHEIPIVESADLARALFARVETDEAIPEDLYAAVAADFAWILRTRGRLGGTPGEPA